MATRSTASQPITASRRCDFHPCLLTQAWQGKAWMEESLTAAADMPVGRISHRVWAQAYSELHEACPEVERPARSLSR
eukprot:748800-Hanusia_phi.AAC.3